MKQQDQVGSGGCHGAVEEGGEAGKIRRWMRRWFLFNAMISGFFALLWLVLRTGRKPSRFAYPCQQAAFGTAAAAFGVPLAATVLSARRRLAWAFATRPGRLGAMLGLVGTLAFGAWALSPTPTGYQAGPHLEPRGGYRAQVFVQERSRGPEGQYHLGLNDLFLWMGLHGLKFYKSPTTDGFETGPDGVVASDDVVVIKINYQWDERGGTNVDVLRGLIRRILDHPDGFTGEVVVCENAQFNSTQDFNYANNNAENHGLSPHDVILEYQGQGHTVSHFDWTPIRNTSVQEFSSGNMTNGYIVYDYNSSLQGRISYPKFQSDYGTYISLKFGVWDNVGQTYDRGHLKFINIPVLKSHHATYGVTACVKHYMGVVSGNLGTNSHSAIYYGIMGALLGEIQLADLNILDCIYINANPFDGPWTTYGGATRVDKLVASLDPVATDIWAAKNILIPAFLANGYTPPWPYPSADPDNPSSMFRIYLDNSMDKMLAAGYDVTNNLMSIDNHNWNAYPGALGDINGDRYLNGDDIADFVRTITGVDTDPYHMIRSDMDSDRDLDIDDITLFVGALLP